MFLWWQQVCTAQYFLWYVTFLPITLPFSKLHLRGKGKSLHAAWGMACTGQPVLASFTRVQTVACVHSAWSMCVTAQRARTACFWPSVTTIGCHTGGALIACWLLSEWHWLYWAYQLEFMGRNTFLQVCLGLFAGTLGSQFVVGID